ncbi:MAG: hypothetical protein FH752_08910 [Marinobacter adhaerens]|uniref:Uncharacterized protein n=1 Tax=Marinobacter adhaerens TaxID=1033846 RepID=A0A844I422_9GAMM|nr:hypothetical protein [Marinobacter adhaerens]
MTSEEFAERFKSHPLGWSFQNLEVAKNIRTLKNTVSMTEGILLLMEFQGDITKPEYEFLREALQGNAQRNLKRIEQTNITGPLTKQ